MTTKPSPTYEQALEAIRVATRVFAAAQADYRARKIGDAEYLAARAACVTADKAFEVAWQVEEMSAVTGVR